MKNAKRLLLVRFNGLAAATRSRSAVLWLAWALLTLALMLPGAARAQACPDISIRVHAEVGGWRTNFQYQATELEWIRSHSPSINSVRCSSSHSGNTFTYSGFLCDASTFTLTGPAASCGDDTGGGDEDTGGDDGDTGGGDEDTGGGNEEEEEQDTSDGAGASDISQEPLFLSASVDPNILFILDDSGSMHFEITPESYIYSSVRYVYPRADNVYGQSRDIADDYRNYVATVDDNEVYARLTRSPQINKTYYDPSVTYRPWVKADGSRYDDASPQCALHNPERGGTGPAYCRDLTQNNTNYNNNRWYACNKNDNGEISCSQNSLRRSFWPAKYYWFEGGDEWNRNNYSAEEIRPSKNRYTGHGRINRTDCDNGVCTYQQEIQNFANWYTYYRSRILAARAGIGTAFNDLNERARVGYGTINKSSTTVDGVRTSTIINGVRPFTGDARDNFYDLLYTRDVLAQDTPLRSALHDAGEYFSRRDDRGPWNETPGESGGSDLSCRKSFTVLMTDGYWSGSLSQNVGNQDGNDGPSIRRPDGTTDNYEAEAPFADNHSNTLADVAMKFWKNDLRDDLTNNVPTNSLNPAFWQHMVTYGVSFGVTGSVDLDEAREAVNSGDSISWPNPHDSEPAKLDDLLHAAINSRGDFFSASDPVEFAAALSSTLSTIVERTRASSTTTVANSLSLTTDSLAYRATLDSANWTGDLAAFSLEVDEHRLEQTKVWSAKDEIPDHDERNILSWDGSSGISFNWSSLSAEQKALLKNNEDLLHYLRGDQSNESRNGGQFRNRTELLGDIVNSDPVYVADDHYGYHTLPANQGGSSYPAFLASKSARLPMVYVGANDGMLHGFNADTGEEVFAYVPGEIYPNLAELSDPGYEHLYYVDGDTHVSDAYLNGSWKTVLLGATGAGGRAIFALDVTNPSSMTGSKVMWEFTHADLGYTMSKAVIARLSNGTWAAIFGNGVGSRNDRAQLFIVNLATGQLIKRIDTGVGSAESPNGLFTPAYVSSADGYATYVYAGDLQGNLWKFDLTSSSSGNWDVAYKNGATKHPLFTARNDSNQVQPITVEPEIEYHDIKGYLVLFGTGKYFSATDPTNTAVQSFYGIWDRGARITQTDRSTLLEQTITHEATVSDFEVRAVSNNTIDWNRHQGWYIDLVSPNNGAEGERVVHPPQIWFDRIRFYTTIPMQSACSAGVSGWQMELDYRSGGRLPYSLYDLDGDGDIDEDDMILAGEENIEVSGIRRDESQGVSPTIYDGKDEYLIDEGIGAATDLNDVIGRKSWRETSY